MSHVRRQIRERAGTTLGNLATTSTRVYQSRTVSLPDSLLPALCIYTLRETSESEHADVPRSQMRTLLLAIEGYARTTADLDDTLDQIALEVEEAMAGDRDLNGLAFETELQAVEFLLGKTQGEEGGDRQIGVVRLTYGVRYQVVETDVETAV